MSETLKIIEQRKSTRGFKPEQISEEQLTTILKAGNEAPIGCAEFSGIHFTVVQNAELLKKISETVKGQGGDLFYGAPTVIVVSAGTQPFPGLELADAGCVVQNFLLAATDLGLGSVYIYSANGAFAADPSLIGELGIPEGFKPVSSVALGYANEETATAPKVARAISTNRI
jgi:nitroreductase